MPARTKDQLALDEVVIPDGEVEAALEERLRRKLALDPVRAAYREADEAAKASIARLELPDEGVARVGRFRITRKDVPARSVSFESGARTRIAISLIEEG